MATDIDVIVVGSGPSGALCAMRLVEKGVRVKMLDVGNCDNKYSDLIPDESFDTIRRNDSGQSRYFLGDNLEGLPKGNVRVGAQLTPPRQFVIQDVDRYLAYSGSGFDPMQSLALGGLGAAWGGACFTYTRKELEDVGIYTDGFGRHYNEVARAIGISGTSEDDISENCFSGLEDPQMPSIVDANAKKLLSIYHSRRDFFKRRGLKLGRTPLALLTQKRQGREANPYFDMDFWSESRRSIFRPQYLIEDLEKEHNFQLNTGQLALSFEDLGERGVNVRYRDLSNGCIRNIVAQRLVLAAGAINTARIALNSFELPGYSVPLLCNPYTYIPCLFWRRLGGKSSDRRHSLSQLCTIYHPSFLPDQLIAQIYSYRSLLLFKLVKEMPLPPWAGLLVARLLVQSLVIMGVHHVDKPGNSKMLSIRSIERSSLPEVEFAYQRTKAEEMVRFQAELALKRLVMRLGLLPLGQIDPGPASSIHYAGTIPSSANENSRWGTSTNGYIYRAPNVFVADSASWRFLPAKGLTFTLMANAIRVAEQVLLALRR